MRATDMIGATTRVATLNVFGGGGGTVPSFGARSDVALIAAGVPPTVNKRRPQRAHAGVSFDDVEDDASSCSSAASSASYGDDFLAASMPSPTATTVTTTTTTTTTTKQHSASTTTTPSSLDMPFSFFSAPPPKRRAQRSIGEVTAEMIASSKAAADRDAAANDPQSVLLRVPLPPIPPPPSRPQPYASPGFEDLDDMSSLTLSPSRHTPLLPALRKPPASAAAAANTTTTSSTKSTHSTKRAFSVLAGDDLSAMFGGGGDKSQSAAAADFDGGGGGAGDDMAMMEVKRNYTRPPDFDEMFREFGEPKKPARCWGCRIADAEAFALPMETYNAFVRLMCKGLLTKHMIAVADQIGAFFKKHIRTLAEIDPNDERAQELWDWRGVDAIWHFYAHTTEASMRTFWLLWEVRTLSEHQFQSKMWKVRKSDGRVVPVSKQWKVFQQMLAAEKSLLSSQPSKMFGYNPRTAISDKEARLLVAIENIVGAPRNLDEAIVNE